MKLKLVCASTGLIGTLVTATLGGWNDAIITLFIFMIIDYITGLICAGVFKKSKKSKSGGLSSSACLKGLFKKVGELILVMIAVRFDMLTGTSYIKDGTIIALIVSETISIIENLGLMGVPIPEIITKSIDLLKNGGKENV